jgi:Druantia protein DruA
MEQQLIVRRRRIDADELDQIRGLIAQEGERGRSYISSQLCELWDWRQANGQFRQIACRDLLRQLEAKGLIELPARLRRGRRPGDSHRIGIPQQIDRTPLHGGVGGIGHQITLERVQGRPQLQLFKGLIGTYHYLGYRQPTGAQLKYLACYHSQPIACLSFGPAAYQLAPRDEWIGWDRERRLERLPWLVNNDRFLILPWVRVDGLASYLLGQSVRRLRADWQQVYRHDVALAESFIQTGRFAGTCYAASHWQCVGVTRGRGRNDRLNRCAAPLKSIWLHPLRPDFREILCA